MGCNGAPGQFEELTTILAKCGVKWRTAQNPPYILKYHTSLTNQAHTPPQMVLEKYEMGQVKVKLSCPHFYSQSFPL